MKRRSPPACRWARTPTRWGQPGGGPRPTTAPVRRCLQPRMETPGGESASFGSMGGMGGFGGNSLMTPEAGATAILPNYPKVEDRFGALQNPDLIQLDVLGAITIYNPPKEGRNRPRRERRRNRHTRAKSRRRPKGRTPARDLDACRPRSGRSDAAAATPRTHPGRRSRGRAPAPGDTVPRAESTPAPADSPAPRLHRQGNRRPPPAATPLPRPRRMGAAPAAPRSGESGNSSGGSVVNPQQWLAVPSADSCPNSPLANEPRGGNPTKVNHGRGEIQQGNQGPRGRLMPRRACLAWRLFSAWR